MSWFFVFICLVNITFSAHLIFAHYRGTRSYKSCRTYFDGPVRLCFGKAEAARQALSRLDKPAEMVAPLPSKKEKE